MMLTKDIIDDLKGLVLEMRALGVRRLEVGEWKIDLGPAVAAPKADGETEKPPALTYDDYLMAATEGFPEGVDS